MTIQAIGQTKPLYNPRFSAQLPLNQTSIGSSLNHLHANGSAYPHNLVQWPGKTQVKFSGQIVKPCNDPQIIDYLKQEITNTEGKTYQLGEILAYLCDHAPAPDSDLPSENKFNNVYSYTLRDDLHISSEDSNRFLNKLRAFGFLVLPKSQENFSKAGLSGLAHAYAREWETIKLRPTPQPTSSTTLKYVRPRVDWSLMTPMDALQRIPLDTGTLRRIEEKLISVNNDSGTTGNAAKDQQMLRHFFRLPWMNETVDTTDINEATRILDQELYGMTEVKDKISKFLATRLRDGNKKGGIILLVGEPGTGKTAIAKAIATAMGRAYVKRSMAVNDPSEITGNISNWVGSEPGRIIQGMEEAGTMNPVFHLDEIDKAGGSNRGTVHHSLLQVLDPDNNSAFQDSFMGIDFDLSNVFFVCTANSLEGVPESLLSRTQIIEVPSYTQAEKMQIAFKHLIPKILKGYNIPQTDIQFEPAAVEKIITEYTREGGVRKLEQRLDDIVLDVNLSILREPGKRITVTPAMVDAILRHQIPCEKINPTELRIGEVNGMYYSGAGGGLIPVQVSISPGSIPLKLTGNLGEVMKESVEVALSFLRENGERLQVEGGQLERLRTDGKGGLSIHVHYPDGATKKDGPSAGSATFASLWSAITQTPIPAGVAITGEIDLKGRIKQIGGLQEKITGAQQAGVTTVILPKANQKDIQDLCSTKPDFRNMLQHMNVHYVDNAYELAEILMQLSHHPQHVLAAAVPQFNHY